MEDARKELLSDDKVSMSLDEILADAELSALLEEPKAPAFEDPDRIHDNGKTVAYNNFANHYGAPRKNDCKTQKNDRVIIGLMITASVLCLGIIGILSYWLSVLL